MKKCWSFSCDEGSFHDCKSNRKASSYLFLFLKIDLFAYESRCFIDVKQTIKNCNKVQTFIHQSSKHLFMYVAPNDRYDEIARQRREIRVFPFPKAAKKKERYWKSITRMRRARRKSANWKSTGGNRRFFIFYFRNETLFWTIFAGWIFTKAT